MSTQTVERRAFNSKESARQIGISENRLRDLLRQGRLQHVRVGRRVIISQAAIDRFLDGTGDADSRDPRL